MMMVAGLFSLLGIVWPHRIMFFVVTLLLAALALTRLAVPFLEAASEIVHPSGKDTEQSLESVRRSLAGILQESSGRVLVVVDDLDRLSPKALAEMVQLFKANGDLPNLLYLLIGDREILASHLSTELHVDGQAYLEKIVQISLDLPTAPIWRVQKVLFEGLDRLLGPKPIADRFQPTHWQEVFPGLAGYFKDLRNVNRFLSTLEFNMGMFRESSAFEVNPVDLIAMETIRLFEPNLYRLIRTSRGALLGETSTGSKAKEQAETLTSTISQAATEERRDQVRQLLPALFPMLRAASNGYSVGRETEATWSRDLRVGSSKHFDKYFEMLSDPRELSDSDIQKFLSADSREECLDILLKFKGRKLLDKAVERLREYESTLARRKIPAVLTSLFDVGDYISNKAAGMFSASPFLQAEFLAGALFERLQPQSALDTLRTSVDLTTGLSLPTELIARVFRKAQDGLLHFGMSEEQQNSLKAVIVQKIESAAADGRLEHNDDFRALLFYWKLWSGSDVAVRAYTKSLTSSQEGVVSFLKGMVVTAHSSTPNKKGGSERYYIRMSEIDEYASQADIDGVLLGYGFDPNFFRTNAEVFGLYRKAVKRRDAGKGDDGFNAFDEDEDEE